MNLHESLCPSCFEAITNPICENCLMEHFRYWLDDRQINNSAKTKIINSVKKSIRAENPNTDECILCGAPAVTICPYCFALKVASKLRALKLPQESVSSFEYSFTDKFYSDPDENEQ